MIDLSREGSVFVLRMNAGENRFNPDFVAAMNAALDEVERSSGDAALVTTGGHEKFYSNGLDLDWMGKAGMARANEFLPESIRLLGRVLASPVPTVAAVNGHAFAAGGMLMLAHDFRVMRADRGFFCLNEVELGLPLAPGMAALVRNRLSIANQRDVLLTAARLGGEECLRRGMVDEAVPAAEVLPRAIARASVLAAKSRQAYGALKQNLYGDVIATLREGALPS
jgi:enoyl-CoA hydratase/carnithine racemase